jgi:colicin import membrane protein
MLALLVHGGLLVALALGVSWRASEPTGATAELWAAVPQFAAPAPVVQPAAPPAPPPPQVAKPKPEPDAAALREAEIAVEKAKMEREREREAKAEAERKRQQAEQEAERKRLAEQEVQRKKLAEQEEQRKKLAEKAEQERVEKQRQENLKRIAGQAGATGAPSATGTAAQDAGPSASYAGRIVARVKPNIVLTDSVPPTLRAEVEVRAAPDGTIIGRRLVKSSGNKDWDEAVLRALDRTEILPRDIDGRVPSQITIGFTP